MHPSDAIINPIKGRTSPDLGPVMVLTATKNDLSALVRRADPGTPEVSPLMMSRVFRIDGRMSAAGPVMGAPYATAVLETLVAWGAKSILFWGLCGSVSSDVAIGDIVVPDSAIVDEGTSRHYHQALGTTVTPSVSVQTALKSVLTENRLPFKEGTVWTTDGVFRETEEKVRQFQGQGAVVVEMEASALFSVGRFRGVAVGALLVVSDELSTYKWRPGFGHQRFKETCRRLPEIVRQWSAGQGCD